MHRITIYGHTIRLMFSTGSGNFIGVTQLPVDCPIHEVFYTHQFTLSLSKHLNPVMTLMDKHKMIKRHVLIGVFKILGLLKRVMRIKVWEKIHKIRWNNIGKKTGAHRLLTHANNTIHEIRKSSITRTTFSA